MLATRISLPFGLSGLLLLLLALSALQPPPGPLARLVARLPHHAALVATSFSADGQRLITADKRSVAAWETKAGQQLGELVSGERMQSVRHGSRGQLVATGLGGVTLFDKSLKRVAGLNPPTGWPRDAGFSPDGRLLAMGFEEEDPPEKHTGGVVLYDAATGQERGLLAQGDPICSVQFRRDGKRLAAQCITRSGTFFQIYEVPSGKFLTSWYTGAFSYSPSGHQFALLRRGHVAAYGADGRLLWTQPVDGGTRALAFSPTSTLLLTWSPGVDSRAAAAVMVWDSATGKPIGRLEYATPPTAVRFHPKKPWLVSGLKTGQVNLRDVRTGKPVVEGLKAGSAVTTLEFDTSGRRLAVGEASGVCSLWELP